MARRNNESCAGTGCAGAVLLVGWVMVGYFLTLPTTMKQLLAVQTPPQQVQGFLEHLVLYAIPVAAALAVAAAASKQRPFIPWLVLARAALVLAAAYFAARWADGEVADVPADQWNIRATAVAGAAGLAVLVLRSGFRAWDQKYGGAAPTRGAARYRARFGHRPVAGQIWLADVPLREDASQTLRHYCVITRTRLFHAEVLQITSKNKDGRRDFIRLPNHGWHENDNTPHWVECGQQPRRVSYGKFLTNRPQGPCPRDAWKQLRTRQPHHPANTTPTTRALWSRLTKRP
ncbi:hypothetical protein [Streptomyces sp. NPDC051211]|uniref:hypothetical protein n=1 Tax=Streptomyces sp. NPDC051211 TaxID=3154643 RepID=UPI00344DDA4D